MIYDMNGNIIGKFSAREVFSNPANIFVLYVVNFQNIIVFKLIKIKIVIYHKSNTIRSVLLMTIFSKMRSMTM
jgi:hypothetical protein